MTGIAFVFPGQGSQSVGMLAELAAAYPVVRATFEEAGAALGEDLWTLVSGGPAERLDQTEHTQPALLAAGVACWRAWRASGGVEPSVMAGHSLGEYTALVCADSLEFSDAVRLVRRRAEFMQSAVPAGVGAMAAIVGLDDDAVQALCADTPGEGVLEAVNFNAPGQVVIAGTRSRVEAAVALAASRGARMTKLLAVSVPSHCALMRPAAEQLAIELKATPVRPPRIPVLHNLDFNSRQNPDDIRQALVEQLYSPVRWVETIRAMKGAGAVIECGPGRVLGGLIKRIEKGLVLGSLHAPDALQQALAHTAG